MRLAEAIPKRSRIDRAQLRMQKRLLINSTAIETRIALVEGSSLAEVHIERGGLRSIVGNIYKGRVLRVLPGMQAAFVDIGLEKAAFMHVSDFWRAPEDGSGTGDASLDGGDIPPDDAESEDEEDEDLATSDPVESAESVDSPAESTTSGERSDLAHAGSEPADLTAPRDGSNDRADDHPARSEAGEDAAGADAAESEHEHRDRDDQPRVKIEDVLHKGQEILVQVSKEPIGNKGARITSHISLPGRYIVYMPTTDHVGVSRRIEDDKERQRLRETVTNARRPGDGGFIVRTACEGVSKREIVSDMRFLARLWKAIVKRDASATAPILLHEDLDIVLRVIRDLFTADVAELVVDRDEDFARIGTFVENVLPQRFRSRVTLYAGLDPIFDHFGIENQLNRALERRVWLKSGGYLVFDQTEALTTVDVNTGRFVGKKTQEETVLKTNLEAAKVVVDHLRLRNIGGIIIIDFIDMEQAANRKKVSEALAEAVKKDKARTNILRISELGLVQMTRKRTRENLRQLMTSTCPTCAGDGRQRSVPTIAADVLRAVRRQCATAGVPVDGVALAVAPEIGDALRSTLHDGLREIERRIGAPIALRPEPRFDRRHFEVRITAGADALPTVATASDPAHGIASPLESDDPDHDG